MSYSFSKAVEVVVDFHEAFFGLCKSTTIRIKDQGAIARGVQQRSNDHRLPILVRVATLADREEVGCIDANNVVVIVIVIVIVIVGLRLYQ